MWPRAHVLNCGRTVTRPGLDTAVVTAPPKLPEPPEPHVPTEAHAPLLRLPPGLKDRVSVVSLGKGSNMCRDRQCF